MADLLSRARSGYDLGKVIDQQAALAVVARSIDLAGE